MGKTAYSLSVLIIGIALGMNFLGKLQSSTFSLILGALFLLNSVTVKELINKNFQLGRATEENLGLHSQIAALLTQSEMAKSLITWLDSRSEIMKAEARKISKELSG